MCQYNRKNLPARAACLELLQRGAVVFFILTGTSAERCVILWIFSAFFFENGLQSEFIAVII